MSTAATGRFFPVQIMHLGSGGTFASLNVSSLGGDGTVASGDAGPWYGQLGQVIEDSNKVYRLIQFDNGSGDVASAAGGVAHWKTRASFIVTSDQTDAQASLNGVAGGFLGVLTDQYYGFIQLGGLQAMTTDTTQSTGTALIASTTDLTLVATTTNTKGNQLIYGISYGTVTTTSVNIYWVFGNLL
jgi:hypothetical protein